MKIEVVDLFCGVGGLSAGFRKAGISVLAGIDFDASCKYAYEKNIKAEFLPANVAELSGSDIDRLYSPGATKVLVGCAPCQPFSMYTGRYRQNETPEDTDKRWNLLREFARIIEEVQPDIVSMENVPRVAIHPAFNSFVDRLKVAGYQVTYQKVRAQNYGVPQRRTRLVLFASKFGEVKLIEPTHLDSPMTVREAIGSLPPIKAGEADTVDRLHQSRNLKETNLRRIRATREGGSWKDWDKSLQLACHRKPEGKSFRAVYGRMRWDEPSHDVTTPCLGIGTGRIGHPEQ
ncbi:DNA cytosine methyltransferase, partial [Rhizobium sp. SEMIA 4085]|uniref:DNA cytosine methyltransferase n=1 Tax=Rhizobium sp. SEMIA 4085 TaxID=2137761 RepID=UPI0014788679